MNRGMLARKQAKTLNMAAISFSYQCKSIGMVNMLVYY